MLSSFPEVLRCVWKLLVPARGLHTELGEAWTRHVAPSKISLSPCPQIWVLLAQDVDTTNTPGTVTCHSRSPGPPWKHLVILQCGPTVSGDGATSRGPRRHRVVKGQYFPNNLSADMQRASPTCKPKRKRKSASGRAGARAAGVLRRCGVCPCDQDCAVPSLQCPGPCSGPFSYLYEVTLTYPLSLHRVLLYHSWHWGLFPQGEGLILLSTRCCRRTLS